MADIDASIVNRIDRLINENLSIFTDAANNLRDQFQASRNKTSIPIVDTLTTAARNIRKEGFHNDLETATVILLLSWMTSKKDANLFLLKLSEFATWKLEDDASTGRSYAGSLMAEHKDWTKIVKDALSVVESKLCTKPVTEKTGQETNFSGPQTEQLEISRKHFNWFRISVVAAIAIPILMIINLRLKNKGNEEVVPTSKSPSFPHVNEPSLLHKEGLDTPTRLTTQGFDSRLKIHRGNQEKSLRDPNNNLFENIGKRAYHKLQLIDNKYTDPNEYMEVLLDAITAECKQHFKIPGRPKIMKKHLPPAPSSAFLDLAEWVENREDQLEPIECLRAYMKNVLCKLYEKNPTLFDYQDTVSKDNFAARINEGVEAMGIDVLVIFHIIIEPLDEKLVEIYQEELDSKVEKTANQILPLCPAQKDTPNEHGTRVQKPRELSGPVLKIKRDTPKSR